MKNYLTTLLALFILIGVQAQKKILDHTDFEIWNSIEDETLSPDGSLIMYSLEKGEADHYLKIKDASGQLLFNYPRGQKGQFTYDSQTALFTIKAWKDSVMDMQRRKVKKNDLPKDSLGIYHVNEGKLEKIGRIKSYKIPEKWSGYLAYQIEEEKKEKKDTKNDSLDKPKEAAKKKEKKVGKKTGYHLLVRDIATGQKDTFKFVTEYAFAKKGKKLAFATTGETKEDDAAVFVLDLEQSKLTKIHHAPKAKYNQLRFSESGQYLGFVTDMDTTKVQIRPTKLFLWKEGQDLAQKIADAASTSMGYGPSTSDEILFSKDESKIYFGLAKPPVVKDTSLTKDEIVNVEVWTYDEPRLYTVQEMDLKRDTVQAFKTVVHLEDLTKVIPLASASYPNADIADEGNARYVLLNTPIPHLLESQWTGRRARDYAVVDTRNGALKKALTKVPGRVEMSPKGDFVFGYHSTDSTWFTYNIEKSAYKTLTKEKVFYNELHDAPSPPSPYGLAGWTADDKAILLYDRFDIWSFDPMTGSAKRITKGRETNTKYRYLQTDEEERFLDPKKQWLFSVFNETDKQAGYASYNPKNGQLNSLVNGPYRYTTPQKAALSDSYVFTRESFVEFPNLWYSNSSFNGRQISDANPQQKDYNWGSIELVTWTSLDGIELTGMLVKPEDFDASKKYPMIVNFYEKSADRLHRHRSPNPGRSTINYSFYTSRGYLIFNPDVHYRIGYPGESAYNCVIPGVTALIDQGFVDKDNIGVQGHSWGGYQIAYLVTKTDIFKAAEAGAPVPNMISAYGGIRWWTGLSRQFQYEHTQSRIGGTPWEYPTRYLENSPIFTLDKINTPLLIMHNDADGHVPWYQGIEFFVSLRRLGKPSWFLNYNGEPHWPLKLQNRKDFNIRMAQFFDHYLKGAPKPVWMDRGVPAIEKGVNQGYELMPADEN